MSAITTVVLIAGYLVVLAFVLVLLTAARDAGDAAELGPPTVAVPDAPLQRPNERAATRRPVRSEKRRSGPLRG